MASCLHDEGQPEKHPSPPSSAVPSCRDQLPEFSYGPCGKDTHRPLPGFIVQSSSTPSDKADFSNNGQESITKDHDSRFKFNDATIRRGFIKKVYGILMCQLLLTSGIIALLTFHEPTKLFIQTHIEVFSVALATAFITICAMACCENLRRRAPMNFIFLGIFTFAEAILLGTIASLLDTEVVFMAAGLTAVICFGLTVFALQTKWVWDLTIVKGGLLVGLIILIVFGIVAIVSPGKTISMIFVSLGVMVFALYLIYDMQKMLGGNHEYSISPEEYVFAALNLYLDILNIFIYILSLIGLAQKPGRRDGEE